MITPVRQPLHRTAKDADRKDVPLSCSSRQADIKADESKTWKASQPGPHRTARPHDIKLSVFSVTKHSRRFLVRR